MNAPARLDIAWNAASGALDASRTWASAVVRLECEWDPATGDASCRASLDRAGDGRELWISYTLDDHRPRTLRSGEPVDDAVVAALDVGATTVLFNCCQAETITPAIDVAVARTAGTAAVGAYANRFVDSHTDDGEANEQLARFRDDLDPTSYGEFVSRWLDAGATVVGGCCGMQPEHVARIRQLVDAR